MAVSKFHSVWKIISEYRLHVDCDSAYVNVKCVICKELMIDACLSTACGCQYCHKCITEYTNVNGKYCPGVKDDCTEQEVIFGTNVFRSEMLNKIISKLNVKCPNESCMCNIELLKMEDHLRLCTNQIMECPYYPIGCNVEQISIGTLDSHLLSEILTHSELLIDLIQNLKNEFNEFKEYFERSKLELTDKEKRIAALEEELRNKREVREHEEKKREEEMNELRRHIAYLTKERENVITTMNDLRNEVKEDFAMNKLEIIYLKEESLSKDKTIVALKEELKDMRSVAETDRINREIDDQRRHIEYARLENDLRKDVNEMREWRKRFDENRDEQMNKCDKLCLNIVADFVWKIDRCSQKIKTDLFSASFYSNNYKLCLYAFINNLSDDVHLRCWIMKGEYDDNVQWPMRRTVTLSIVDQVTLRAHTCDTYKYDTYRDKRAFNKPKNDINDYYIGPPFIKYSFFKKKASFIVDDSIVVSCVITDP